MPTTAQVLVIGASATVGLALDRRLAPCSTLRHADALRVPHDPAAWRAYDVVIVDPYLDEPARERIAREVAGAGPPPTLVLLHDRPARQVEVAAGGDPGAAGVRRVLEALAAEEGPAAGWRSVPGVDAVIEVTDNSERERYEITVDGKLAGFVMYRRRPALIALVHTEVDSRFEGQGLGGRLIGAALDDARAEGLAVLPFCPFANAYIQHHLEYADLVPDAYRAQFGV
jgi:predicted GNAT family acetyltransferase